MEQGVESETERVVRRLRDEILDGARKPGSKLVERDLAADLGVSRVPVREFTASDIADLQEVRAALGVLTFKLAATRHSRAGLEQLRAALDEETSAAAAGDAVTARRAAADFHEAVTAMAGNELLDELELTLRSRMRWLLGQHEDLERVAGNTGSCTRRSPGGTWMPWNRC
ncbi:GntR family transcriptional regulator [Amycolatopsis silviterrae]|uniref:GntR family transcriptional regulator n=1 Tax=Amycolatopsis silviterrae TaxID=1656914 RepID=A0ABW5H361_9PSEU